MIIKILNKGGYGNPSNVLSKVRGEMNAQSQPTIDKLVKRVQNEIKIGTLQKQNEELDAQLDLTLGLEETTKE